MKLNYLTISVRDIENTCRFYSELAGLKEVRRISPKGGEIVFMSNGDGETMLEFICFEGVQAVSASGLTLSFKTEESLESLRIKAKDMGYHPTDIIDIPPKPAHFKVNDTNGIEVEFSI